MNSRLTHSLNNLTTAFWYSSLLCCRYEYLLMRVIGFVWVICEALYNKILTMPHQQKTGSFAKRNQHQKPKPGLTSQVLLYFGLILLLFSILYLLLNRANADSIMGSLLPFLIGGAALVVISQVMKSNKAADNIFNGRKKK